MGCSHLINIGRITSTLMLVLKSIPFSSEDHSFFLGRSYSRWTVSLIDLIMQWILDSLDRSFLFLRNRKLERYLSFSKFDDRRRNAEQCMWPDYYNFSVRGYLKGISPPNLYSRHGWLNDFWFGQEAAAYTCRVFSWMKGLHHWRWQSAVSRWGTIPAESGTLLSLNNWSFSDPMPRNGIPCSSV